MERENLPIPSNPDFSTQMGGIRPDDPVHYNQINEMFVRLLTNEEFVKKAIDKANNDKDVLIPLAGWSTEAPYIQTIPLANITERDTPITGIKYPNDIDAIMKKDIDKSVGMLTKIVTVNGGLLVECKFSRPVADIPLVLKGVI